MSKRVLIVSTNYLPQAGGVEMVVDNLAIYLASKGEQVTIITSRAGAARYGTETRNGFVVLLQLQIQSTLNVVAP